MRARLVAGFLLLAAPSATAQEMQNPKISQLQVEWDSVIGTLNGLDALQKVSPAAGPAKFEMLARLNRVTAERFPMIGASPVPVLLPFDVNAYLRDRTTRVVESHPGLEYLSSFHDSNFFLVGPGGYDAAFTVRPSEVPALSDVSFAGQVEIQISGMAFFYDLGEAVGAEPRPMTGVTGLQGDFPGLRRIYLESHLR